MSSDLAERPCSPRDTISLITSERPQAVYCPDSVGSQYFVWVCLNLRCFFLVQQKHRLSRNQGNCSLNQFQLALAYSDDKWLIQSGMKELYNSSKSVLWKNTQTYGQRPQDISTNHTDQFRSTTSHYSGKSSIRKKTKGTERLTN